MGSTSRDAVGYEAGHMVVSSHDKLFGEKSLGGMRRFKRPMYASTLALCVGPLTGWRPTTG